MGYLHLQDKIALNLGVVIGSVAQRCRRDPLLGIGAAVAEKSLRGAAMISIREPSSLISD